MEAAIIVKERMFDNDAFSQWLGIVVEEVSPGQCRLRMEVRNEMTNGFGITHGGITYSIADSALAFASNGHGAHAVSVETSISHVKPVLAGDVLTAIAIEKNKSKKIGIYHIEVSNQNSEIVALFQGTVYFKDKKWE